MKMIAGAFFLAARKRRRILAAPRPANISTNEDADWEKNLALDSWATAFARRVLPVPGGPWSRMPLWHPGAESLNRRGSRRKSTTSRNSSLASSTPATSSHRVESELCGLIC